MELLQILTYLNGQTSYLIGSTEQMLLQQVSSLCKNMTHKKNKIASKFTDHVVPCKDKMFSEMGVTDVGGAPSPLSSLQLNSPTGQLYRASLIFGPRRIKY